MSGIWPPQTCRQIYVHILLARSHAIEFRILPKSQNVLYCCACLWFSNMFNNNELLCCARLWLSYMLNEKKLCVCAWPWFSDIIMLLYIYVFKFALTEATTLAYVWVSRFLHSQEKCIKRVKMGVPRRWRRADANSCASLSSQPHL
jgi:hypothetical protein